MQSCVTVAAALFFLRLLSCEALHKVSWASVGIFPWFHCYEVNDGSKVLVYVSDKYFINFWESVAFGRTLVSDNMAKFSAVQTCSSSVTRRPLNQQPASQASGDHIATLSSIQVSCWRLQFKGISAPLSRRFTSLGDAHKCYLLGFCPVEKSLGLDSACRKSRAIVKGRPTPECTPRTDLKAYRQAYCFMLYIVYSVARC